jgi:N6-L-threonylcarbamoyladenine synthase
MSGEEGEPATEGQSAASSIALSAGERERARPALVVAGGVAANRAIRSALAGAAERHGFRFVAPPAKLCGDNGVMIAWAGAERLALGLTDPLSAPALPRWPLDASAVGGR